MVRFPSTLTLSHFSEIFAVLHFSFQRADPENGPDLVIAADTVVLTHVQPFSSGVGYSELPSVKQELLEKPADKADNLRMLQDLNGSVCEVVTGVSLGGYHFWTLSCLAGSDPLTFCPFSQCFQWWHRLGSVYGGPFQ